MIRLPVVPMREQSRGEEISNSISHGIGLIAAIVATPFLLVRAAQHNNNGYIVSASIFAATVLLLYLVSTLYHTLPRGKVKRAFRVIEHSAIFFLIAGTYTPFTVCVLRGAWGWTIFGLIWGLAIIGVVLKVFDRISHPIVSVGLYLLMGLLILIAVSPLSARVPTSGLLWLAAGGVAYIAGLVFFAANSCLRYGHFIWHLFVMVGTTCHYFAIFWYVA